jgi:hypothetical protein
MAMNKFTVPNWAQKLIAVAAKLKPDDVSVVTENERLIVFLRHTDRREFLVEKTTGNVVEN